MLKRISLCLFSSLLIFIASQANSTAQETGKITSLIVESDHVISVLLDGTNDTTDCTGGGRWTVSTSDALYKEKYAALLSAATTYKTITLFKNGGGGEGCSHWDSNKIYYIRIDYQHS